MSGPVVLFAETASQLSAVADRSGVLVVAMNAAVDYAAERSGRAVTPIETLAPEAEFARIGDDNIDRVERLCARVDELARIHLEGIGGAGDVSMLAFFHYLKTNIDGVVIRIEQIARACDRLQPHALIAPRCGPYRPTGMTSFDKPATGMTSRLVPAFAAARGLRVEWMEAVPELSAPAEGAPAPQPAAEQPVPPAPEPAAMPAPRAGLKLPRRIIALARRLLAPAPKPAPPPSGPLLLHALFEDLGEAITDLWERRGLQTRALDAFIDAHGTAAAPERFARCEALLASVLSDPIVQDCLTHDGLPFADWLVPQLRMMIGERYPALIQCALSADAALGGAGQSVIIAGGMVDRHHVIGRIARRHGVPFVSHHYGGFLGFSLLPSHERYDLAECDYFICGGPEGRDTFRAPAPMTRWNEAIPRARPVALGLPWVEQSVRASSEPRAARARPRVMVVANATVGDCRYLGYVFPPEIAYWRFLRRLIEVLRRLDVDVVVKLPLEGRYPQNVLPVRDWLRDIGAQDVAIAPDAPLSECMDLADAFVLESPSTPLLHVLATQAPLALYVDRTTYRLVPAARPLLAARCAVFGETEEDFFIALGNAGRDAFVPDGRSRDSRFRHAFLTGQSATPAVERIVDFLHRAGRDHPLPDPLPGEVRT
jgi:hypothetical protein